MMKLRRTVTTFLLIALLGGTFIPWHSVHGSTLSPMARIALFLNPEGDGFRQVTPVITLSSPSSLSLEIESNGTRQPWLQLGAHGKVSFSLNQHTIHVVTTSQRQEALLLVQSLTNANQHPILQELNLYGQSMYRVTVGAYPTLDAAKQGLATIQNIVHREVHILGPYQLVSQAFAQYDGAKQLQQLVLQSGLEAYIGEELTPQGIIYRVGVGAATSSDGLNQIRQQLIQATPAVTWTDSTQLTQAILWRWTRQDATLSPTPYSHYVMSGVTKLYASSTGDGHLPPLIQVDEKYQRQYRGTMELQPIRGALALINQLPVEEYLYGVVGTEMAGSWPLEALKAQSVLARTYYSGLGNKYGVAVASDSTFEQAYKGYLVENDRIRQAVDGTQGMVLYYGNKLAQAFYYSNAGGQTAEGQEVWGNSVPYLQSVISNDAIASQDKPIWYQVELPNGVIGYIRQDLISILPETNTINLQKGYINGDMVNVRSGPSTSDHPIIAKVERGVKVTILGQRVENNSYEWVVGPFTGDEIQKMLQSSSLVKVSIPQPVQHLEVSQTGPSGRVLQVKADSQVIQLSSPDSYRSIFRYNNQSLRSNRFTIEETGNYQVLGANGVQLPKPDSTLPLYTIAADQQVRPLTQEREQFLVYDHQGNLHQLSSQPMFLINGKGFGHGLGLSQYGAKGMAEQGYDYLSILHHYFTTQVEIRSVIQ